jgi:hypothetical protein
MLKCQKQSYEVVCIISVLRQFMSKWMKMNSTILWKHALYQTYYSIYIHTHTHTHTICRGHPIVFIKLKNNKIISRLKHNNIFYFIFIMTTCFGQLINIRSSSQNFQYSACWNIFENPTAPLIPVIHFSLTSFLLSAATHPDIFIETVHIKKAKKVVTFLTAAIKIILMSSFLLCSYTCLWI